MYVHKEIGTAVGLIGRNLRALLAFELVYKLMFTGATVEVIRILISLSMQASGVAILTQENALAWACHPVSVLCMIVILLLAVFITLFDMIAVIHALNASHHRQRVTVREMFAAGAEGAARALEPRNWLLWVFVLVVVPLTGVSAVSGFITQIRIPGFIQDYIFSRTALAVAAVAGELVLMVIAFSWSFSVHAFLYESKAYPEACRKSTSLLKKRKLHTLFALFAWALCITTLGVGLNELLCGVARLILGELASGARQTYLNILVAAAIQNAIAYLSGILAVPLTFSLLSSLYYDYAAADGREPAPYRAPRMPRRKHRIAWGLVGVTVACLLLSSILGGAYTTLESLLPGAQPEIAAHRGSSVERPENSMPAYEQAIADGADWIELDVHRTSDGVIVISHDANIKRIAGVNRNIYDMTYAELAQYDVGSWFSTQYKDLRVLTLEEVLKALKGRIKVNIELKPTGHEKALEESVIQVVRDTGFEQDCVLASLNTASLKRVKELAPDLQTLYLLIYGDGDLYDADFADGYSIEASSLSAQLVQDIHFESKKVWAWTLNTTDSVRQMQELGVDYLLTDDPIMARAVVTAASRIGSAEELFDTLFSEDAEQEDLPESETEQQLSERA